MYLVLPHSRGCFRQDFSCPAVLKTVFNMEKEDFRVQDYHLLWFHFPVDFTNPFLLISHAARHEQILLTTPSQQRLAPFASP